MCWFADVQLADSGKKKSTMDILRMKWQFISLHMVYNLFHAA